MSDRPSQDQRIRIGDVLRRFAVEFDARFDAYLAGEQGVPEQLREAIRYSALASGKRIRPFLSVHCCELVGGRREAAWPVAAAVECVHAFSLIHDDLPAMDNDDTRRGEPACHIRFGEALAILAGDALLARSFECLTLVLPDSTGRNGPCPREAGEPRISGCGTMQDEANRRAPTEGEMVARLCRELAAAAGWAGMIGGQALDVFGEHESPDPELVKRIHLGKTAALFRAACRMGAMVGRAACDQVAALGGFGESLGLAFQIADDLLDVGGVQAELGKAVGKDGSAGKQTLVRCLGVEESRRQAAEAQQRARAWLDSFGPAADDLRDLLQFAVDRNY